MTDAAFQLTAVEESLWGVELRGDTLRLGQSGRSHLFAAMEMALGLVCAGSFLTGGTDNRIFIYIGVPAILRACNSLARPPLLVAAPATVYVRNPILFHRRAWADVEDFLTEVQVGGGAAGAFMTCRVFVRRGRDFRCVAITSGAAPQRHLGGVTAAEVKVKLVKRYMAHATAFSAQ